MTTLVRNDAHALMLMKTDQVISGEEGDMVKWFRLENFYFALCDGYLTPFRIGIVDHKLISTLFVL